MTLSKQNHGNVLNKLLCFGDWVSERIIFGSFNIEILVVTSSKQNHEKVLNRLLLNGDWVSKRITFGPFKIEILVVSLSSKQNHIMRKC